MFPGDPFYLAARYLTNTFRVTTPAFRQFYADSLTGSHANIYHVGAIALQKNGIFVFLADRTVSVADPFSDVIIPHNPEPSDLDFKFYASVMDKWKVNPRCVDKILTLPHIESILAYIKAGSRFAHTNRPRCRSNRPGDWGGPAGISNARR